MPLTDNGRCGARNVKKTIRLVLAGRPWRKYLAIALPVLDSSGNVSTRELFDRTIRILSCCQSRSAIGQSTYLARAQAVDGEQPEDGVIPKVCWLISRCLGQQAADLVPRRPERQTFMPVAPWQQDRCCHARSHPAAILAVYEPRANHLGGRAQRAPAPPRSHVLEVGVDVVGLDVAERDVLLL